MRYHLQGGTYTDADDVTTNGPISVYGTGGDDAVTYIVPDADTLVKGFYNWMEWREDPSKPNTKIDTTTTPSPTYAGSGNKDLYAVYDATGFIETDYPNKYNLSPDWVSIGKNGKNPKEDAEENGTVEILAADLEANGSLVWTITVPRAPSDDADCPDDFKYDSIYIEVRNSSGLVTKSNTETDVGPGGSATLVIKDFNLMEIITHNAMIIAETAFGLKSYTLPVVLDVRD